MAIFAKLREVNCEVGWVCMRLAVSLRSQVSEKHRISSIKRTKSLWTSNLQ